MADDRSLADVIRFVDPSGDISDADIASITKNLKFTEVLDLITHVGKDDLDSARQLLSKYDQRFSIAKEYTSIPMTGKSKSMFEPIRPKGSVSITPMSRGQGDVGDDSELDAMLQDPTKQNDPNVKQIKSILQRMKR
jgi:hypothetical protein